MALRNDVNLKSEQEVTHLYSRLWQHIDDFQTSQVIDQFLYILALPRDWCENKCCIDVGTGSGFAIWVLLQLGAILHACDLGYLSLKQVQKTIHPACDLINSSVLQLPYQTNTFDFVYCNNLHHHTTNPRLGFNECVRVASPGGILFVGLYGKRGIYNTALHFGRMFA